MLVGYNNNVTYKGKVYHVQTEDSGLNNPIIVTLLYIKGTILASKKTSYSHLIGNKDIKKSVRELMKEQHKAILKELIAGKYTGDEAEEEKKEEPVSPGLLGTRSPDIIGAEPEMKKTKDKTLDDILLDYIMQREKKK
jgi:ketol-acid reductoisomerase